MPGWQNQPADLRGSRRRSDRLLVTTVIAVLLVVGSIAIGLVYGWSAILSGLICLLPGAGGLLLLWLLLQLIEGWLDHSDRL